jgi:hypothetical protein
LSGDEKPQANPVLVGNQPPEVFDCNRFALTVLPSAITLSRFLRYILILAANQECSPALLL